MKEESWIEWKKDLTYNNNAELIRMVEEIMKELRQRVAFG